MDTMKAAMIKEQIGWDRVGLAICQKELLASVYEWDFDLTDERFRIYVRNRTGVIYNEEEQSTFDNETKESFLDNDDNWFSLDGLGYTPDEMNTFWYIHLLGRGRLQDLWELYDEMPDSKRNALLDREKKLQQKKQKEWESSDEF